MTDHSRNNGSHRRTVFGVLIIVAAMTVLGFASPQLYETFCKVTGFDGTTSVAAREADHVLSRQMTVKFDSNSADDRLAFIHQQRKQIVKVGQTNYALFEAVNVSDKVIYATATYNVTPLKMGKYFQKLECFCFEKRKFAPGEKVLLPVVYYIDPEIDENPFLNELGEITLSYTFLGINEVQS